MEARRGTATGLWQRGPAAPGRVWVLQPPCLQPPCLQPPHQLRRRWAEALSAALGCPGVKGLDKGLRASPEGSSGVLAAPRLQPAAPPRRAVGAVPGAGGSPGVPASMSLEQPRGAPVWPSQVVNPSVPLLRGAGADPAAAGN